jgi:hypothetical protein
MEKEFIPYEQALALKELGFDEPCFTFYNGKFIEFKIWDDNGATYPQINVDMDIGKCVSAPTFSQAFRWFREKYNLHAEITWSPSYEYEPGQWSDAIYEITIVNVSYTKEWEAESPDMQRANGRQLTYEESELACLKKLIEIVEAL